MSVGEAEKGKAIKTTLRNESSFQFTGLFAIVKCVFSLESAGRICVVRYCLQSLEAPDEKPMNGIRVRYRHGNCCSVSFYANLKYDTILSQTTQNMMQCAFKEINIYSLNLSE